MKGGRRVKLSEELKKMEGREGESKGGRAMDTFSMER